MAMLVSSDKYLLVGKVKLAILKRTRSITHIH